jgi:hypothetical protein
LVQLGRWDEAAEAFEVSRTVGEARQAPYDVALALRAIARLAHARGQDASETERTSDDLLHSIGVVAVPELVILAPTDADAASPEPLRYVRVPSRGSISAVRT